MSLISIKKEEKQTINEIARRYLVTDDRDPIANIQLSLCTISPALPKNTRIRKNQEEEELKTNALAVNTDPHTRLLCSIEFSA